MKITIELNGLGDLLELKTWLSHLQPSAIAANVTELGLDERTLRCLNAENITSTDQLIGWTANDLLKTPNLGRKSLNAIKDALAARGMTLKC